MATNGGGGGGGDDGDGVVIAVEPHQQKDARISDSDPDQKVDPQATRERDTTMVNSGNSDDEEGDNSYGQGDRSSEKSESQESSPKESSCEWNYINVIIAVFCAVLVIVLLALLIYYLVLNTGTVRTYYIGIEEVQWSYTPEENLCGPAFDDAFAQFGNASLGSRIGHTYRKARYVQYTDETFTNKTSDSATAAADAHLGILGPRLRAAVGETLRIVLRNDASFPFSINPWGLRIAKASEGAGYDDGSFFFEKYDDAVAPLALNQLTCTGFGINVQTGCRPFLVHPGQFVTQDWPVTADAGPQEGDGDSVMWLYTSDVDGQIQPGINAGLVGAVIVDRATGTEAPDYEFVNVFLNSDENESPYLDTNMWDALVKASYGEVVKGWVPFGFLDQAEVLRVLYVRAATATAAATRAVDNLDYETAAVLVEESIATQQPVEIVNGVHIHVQFTDPASNPVDSNSFDPTAFNGRYGDGAAQATVHALFVKAMDELKNDEAFLASNRVHTINGLGYCNQPGLEIDASQADRAATARWYTSAVGDSGSIHVPLWTGNPSLGAGRDGAGTGAGSAQVITGSTSVVDVEVANLQPGTWVFQDAVLDHASAGARSSYTVILPDDQDSEQFVDALTAEATIRSYSLAAVAVDWDYLPSEEFGESNGTSACASGAGSEAAAQFLPSKFSIGSRYAKWRFLECEDADACTTTKEPKESLGILGPTLEVAAGEQLQITLFNQVDEDIALWVDGLLSKQSQEELVVAPGTSETFTWFATEEAASPSPEKGNSSAWAYYAAGSSHINAGLLGAVVVSNEYAARVDEEYVLFIGTFDENESPLATQNAMDGLTTLSATLDAAAFPDAVESLMTSNTDFQASNVMPHINGRAYCTLPTLTARKGDAVRFHLLAARTNAAVHSGRVSGHDTTIAAHRVQAATLFPGSSVSFTTVARPGQWEVSDGAADAFDAGVRAAFKVQGTLTPSELPTQTKQTRTFFIAADEVEWDYAPSGYNKCQATAFDKDSDSAKYMVQGKHRIGSKYVKAQYRRYTDDTFQYLQSGTVSRGNSASQHLGLLGTVMTVEVGDTLVVHFKNKLRYPANLVPPGPFQSGAQTTKGAADGSLLEPVAPGETKIYTWVITEEMGPASEDANSIVWTYAASVHDEASGITPTAMLHAGLLGAIIVVRQDEMKASQSMPTGVQLEFLMLTGTIDENLSPYLRLNTQRYADHAYSVFYGDADFQESNRMRSINGLMYCNGEGWAGNLFSHARFYLFSMNGGIQSLNLHGHSIVDQGTGQNEFGLNVFVGGTATGDVVLSSPGDWLLESSIASDTPLGAQELFTVHPLVTQFFKQTASGFQQRDSNTPTNGVNSVQGTS